MKTKLLVSVVFVALLAATAGFGQTPKCVAKIDFPFAVMGKVLPAGQYEFSRNTEGTAFRVTEVAKNGTLVPVITRIAGAMHSTPEDAQIVFDVVGEKSFLSEIWLPGEDGYLMTTTKEKHTHQIINVK